MANQSHAQIVLTLAQKQGLLLPSNVFNTCLHNSINSANLLLYYLAQAKEQGLDVQQISQRSQLHPNTCKTFLRALLALGYVSRMESPNNSPIGAGGLKAVWFYSEK